MRGVGGSDDVLLSILCRACEIKFASYPGSPRFDGPKTAWGRCKIRSRSEVSHPCAIWWGSL